MNQKVIFDFLVKTYLSGNHKFFTIKDLSVELPNVRVLTLKRMIGKLYDFEYLQIQLVGINKVAYRIKPYEANKYKDIIVIPTIRPKENKVKTDG